MRNNHAHHGRAAVSGGFTAELFLVIALVAVALFAWWASGPHK